MIFLPTMGRPWGLERFIGAYTDTGSSSRVAVVFDGGDPCLSEYEKIQAPDTFTGICVSPGTKIGPIMNDMYGRFPDEDYYACLNDDVVMETPGWDSFLGKVAGRDKVAWGDDGIHGINLATMPFIGGDLIRKIGYYAPSGLLHCFIDNFFTDLARELGITRYLPQVKMTHLHHTNGKAPMDDTYRAQPLMEEDGVRYAAFCLNKMPELVQRLRGGVT